MIEIQEFMDSVDCNEVKEMKSIENTWNKTNESMSNSDCHGICNLIPHSQYAIVKSSCPLPDNVIIGVIGRPGVDNADVNREVHRTEQLVHEIHESNLKLLHMKKDLLDMLRESNIILEKANSLKDLSRIVCDDCSFKIDGSSRRI